LLEPPLEKQEKKKRRVKVNMRFDERKRMKVIIVPKNKDRCRDYMV